LKHGSAALVEAAEAKLRGEAVEPAVYQQALSGLLNQPEGERMDRVVLACTHFPLVEAELAAAAGRLGTRPLTFVDGSAGIARRCAHLLDGVMWPAVKPEGVAIFTGGVEGLAPLAPALHGFGLTRLEGL
jgi:glutamate racemase